MSGKLIQALFIASCHNDIPWFRSFLALEWCYNVSTSSFFFANWYGRLFCSVKHFSFFTVFFPDLLSWYFPHVWYSPLFIILMWWLLYVYKHLIMQAGCDIWQIASAFISSMMSNSLERSLWGTGTLILMDINSLALGRYEKKMITFKTHVTD